MTRDELDSATDEQLNVMAAKMIYGIMPRWVRGLGTTETVLIYNDNPFFIDGMCTVDELRKHAMPKSPATDIADAWELVEKMAEREWRLWPVPDWHGEWQGLCYHKDTFIAQTEWMKSAPRAITTAALLAWGEKA